MKTSNVASGMVVQHSAWSIPYVIGVAATLPLMSDHARGRGWLMREETGQNRLSQQAKGCPGRGVAYICLSGDEELAYGIQPNTGSD